MLDAKVRLLPSAPRALKRTSTIKLYSATSQRLARMTLIEETALEPGRECYAQIRLAQPLCVFRGDRIVLRGESPEFTIGGGLVLDIAPIRYRRKDRERSASLRTLEESAPVGAALEFISREKMGAPLREIALRACEPIDRLLAVAQEKIKGGEILSADVGGDLLVISRDAFEGLKEALVGDIAAFFAAQPHRLFMPREELRSRLGPDLAPQLFEMTLTELTGGGKIEDTREGLSLSGRKAEITPAQQTAKEKIERIFQEAACSPPTFSQVEEQFDDPRTAKRMTALLLEEGVLTKISPTLACHKDNLDPAFDKIREHLKSADKLGVGDLKTLLRVSRKHAVPLLEYFDKIGFTVRVGDHRMLKEKLSK
jgi:selenocysteine-specific elongation factor